jgi:hypothetical protein
MGHPTTTDTNLFDRITDAIPAAQQIIDGDTGRTFEASTRTITFGASDYRVLRVPDLVSVTTLKLDDNDDGVFEITVPATDYELDTIHTTQAGWPYDTVRLLERNFPTHGNRRRRIEIVGSWGWSAVPSSINQACALLAARIAQRPSKALFGTETMGDLGAAMIRNSDPDYLRLIGQYVKPMVA